MLAADVQPVIKRTTSQLTLIDRWIHFLARFSINRMGHRIDPGLYCVGEPDAESSVFVTANYSLSFDALRTAICGLDAYILVLDTKGINVWCAAGKGTFGTNELVHRIELCQLSKIVNHRVLILPQLGATGVAAHLVEKRTGFTVEFGPVRAADLTEYLKNGPATPEMRRVYFNFKDRLVLVPVEFIGSLTKMLILAIPFYFIGGYQYVIAIFAAITAATVLFPLLLPWIPTTNFSTKGFIIGGLVALPFFMISLMHNPEVEFWKRFLWGSTYMFTLPALTAFLTLNFTGATTFTSRTGLKREMFRYIPVMAWMFGGGIVLALILNFYYELGA